LSFKFPLIPQVQSQNFLLIFAEQCVHEATHLTINTSLWSQVTLYFAQTVPLDNFCIWFHCRKDATLKELMSLVKEVNPDARRKGTVFDFAIVFPDARRGGFIMKEIGSTAAGRKGTDDAITLESKKFQIGDFIDVAIQSPRIGRRDRPY